MYSPDLSEEDDKPFREHCRSRDRRYDESRRKHDDENTKKTESKRRRYDHHHHRSRHSRDRHRDERSRPEYRSRHQRDSSERHRDRSRSSSSSTKENHRRDQILSQTPTSSKMYRDKLSRKREDKDGSQKRLRKDRSVESSKRDFPAYTSRSSQHRSSSRSKETARGDDLKVGSTRQTTHGTNEGSTDRPVYFSHVHANYINFGHVESTQDGCVNIVGGLNNVQQPPSSGKPVEDMLKAINKEMWNKVNCKNKIFQTENLNEPKKEVYPQIAESPNFYKGEHIVEIRPSSTTHSERREYVKDQMFQFKTRSETQSVSFEALMQEFCKRPGSDGRLTVFGLFAQAGAGKTTYMRYWAKRTLEDNGISSKNNYLSPPDNRFQLLLYYDLKDFAFQDATKAITLRELLFGGMVDDTQLPYDWLMENQSKVVMFFDGLDQAPWQITKQHETGIRPKQEANIPMILCNLLSRNLLPETRIVISSREFKASSLPNAARPAKVYTLTGFSLEDTKSLFNTLVSENHENVCEQFSENKEEEDPQDLLETPYEKFSKTLSFQHFLTIPMFLTFAALVYKSYAGFLPSSVTALLAKVLELLQSSDVTQEWENIWKIISKLKILAHEGMKNGVVVFTNEDLEDQGLTIKDARDLLLMVPVSKPLSQRLLEGDFTLFFCHQIIQEFLSACFIVELSLEHFSDFVEENIHKKQWSVVRRFVCGLLFRNSVNKNLVKISDKEKKRRILRESLVCKLSMEDDDDDDDNDDHELIATISESDDSQLIWAITKIDLAMTPLTRDAAHMMSSLMARTGELKNLCFNGINEELLNVMTANLEHAKVRIGKIQIYCGDADWFSASAFNNVFQGVESEEMNIDGNIKVDSKHQDAINLENIKRLKIHASRSDTSITFLNHPEYVPVSVFEKDNDTFVESEIFSGTFDKKDGSLIFNGEVSERCDILWHQSVAFRNASGWLKSKSVSIDMKGAPIQYLYYKDLHEIEKWQTHLEIIEIVLDAIDAIEEGEENLQIFRDKIMSLVKLFQVKILNTAIELKDLHHFPPQLHDDLSAIDCELKIYVCVRTSHDIQELIPSFKESQVQYCQVNVTMLLETDVENLVSFIKSCNVTKRLVMRSFQFPDAVKHKFKDAAEISQISLKLEECNDRDSKDPWTYVR